MRRIDGERYLSFGFSSKANLDDGGFWPTAYAVTTLSDADAEKLAELVRASHVLTTGPRRGCNGVGSRWALSSRTQKARTEVRARWYFASTPPGIRTQNLRIKSPLLCH